MIRVYLSRHQESGCQTHALKEEIFVKVNLEKITCDVNNNEFSNIISSINSNLKPSIETMMHAIMPQRYIFHMHMIDILKELYV